MKISTYNADNISRAATELLNALNDTNNELQEELIHLQLAQTGVEEKDWVNHTEHLDRAIKETQDAAQYVFEVSKQLEQLVQLIDPNSPSETQIVKDE